MEKQPQDSKLQRLDELQKRVDEARRAIDDVKQYGGSIAALNALVAAIEDDFAELIGRAAPDDAGEAPSWTN